MTGKGNGVFLSVRSRQQVGRSRLVEEFLRRGEAPGAFFTAAEGASVDEEVHTARRRR